MQPLIVAIQGGGQGVRSYIISRIVELPRNMNLMTLDFCYTPFM